LVGWGWWMVVLFLAKTSKDLWGGVC